MSLYVGDRLVSRCNARGDVTNIISPLTSFVMVSVATIVILTLSLFVMPAVSLLEMP
jgi:hypothetical protein